MALIKATTDSLVICLKVFLASSELFAKPCTMIAEDCVPTFPPVPPISGMYSAISGWAAKVESKDVYKRQGKRLLPVWPSKNYQTDRASLHVPEEYFPNPLRAIGVLAMTPSGRPMYRI